MFWILSPSGNGRCVGRMGHRGLPGTGLSRLRALTWATRPARTQGGRVAGTWEQDLVRTHVLAAYLTSDHPRPPQAANSMEETAGGLVAGSLTPLLSGTLVIRYRATVARPWAAYWEFSDEDSGATWHAVLVGDQGIDQLSRERGGSRRGQKAGWDLPPGWGRLTRMTPRSWTSGSPCGLRRSSRSTSR